LIYITGTTTGEIIGAEDFTTADRAEKSSDIIMKNGDTYQVEFINHGSEGDNKNNFIVTINNTASMYADWYDYLQDKGGWNADGGFVNADLNITNPYQYSNDGGLNSKNLDWNDYSHIRNSLVNLTIKYENGVVTIEGSATNRDDANYIFYYGYKYTVNDENANAIINLSVCKSWLDILSVEQTFAGATMGANGYTTFASPYCLDLANLPEGLKAYTATLDGKTLSFAECTQAVPVGTGLLLAGTGGETYNIPVTTTDTAVSGNALTGVTTTTNLKSDETNYIFAMRKASQATDPLTFAPLATTNVSFPAGKAYITVPVSAFNDGARALTISFEEATGIQELKNSRIEGLKTYYDLQGRRVALPTKGLYIVNGAKVVIK